MEEEGETVGGADGARGEHARLLEGRKGSVIGHLLCSPSNASSPSHSRAPEQMNKKLAVTSKSDIWAFACTLIHMLTGKAPFDGYNIMEIMFQVCVWLKGEEES